MAVTTPITLDRGRIQELIEREEQTLNERTGGSGEMYKRANQVLSAGVASSYQLRDPWPIYLERGAGPKVWDVDGNEMWDFHNGFGAMVQGHAHPAIGRAIRSATASAPTSPRRPRTRSSSARSSSAAGTCRAGATRTPAPSRRWTRSGSRAPTPGARRS